MGICYFFPDTAPHRIRKHNACTHVFICSRQLWALTCSNIRKIDIPSRPQKMTLAPALTRKQNGNIKRLAFKNPDTLPALDIFNTLQLFKRRTGRQFPLFDKGHRRKVKVKT